ncbi:alpha/beta fold hydrolase [Janthinobacterium sp. UMAB-60]|uniref:alpha/beta fold hydrolase n=1 Tax=Janthinobacterium sp. UMAB-60 TaxID=1365365 RepID=UPI001C588D0F|nr:alpha/beta hydrolase [Janthinobacterium sp. UMAB-60]
MPINGIEQWITVTGAACGNPVILFIHGGPGNSLSPFADAIYLRQHLDKDKVILMGSSWGSIPGVHMARARPDLFHAYIGTAQVVNARDNETGMYREVLALAQ